MMEAKFHIAQVNLGRVLAPLDTPQMAGFMTMLDEINALADASPGFVWRFQDDLGNATYFRPYPEDDRILFNMSVWVSIEALMAFVYRSGHTALMRRRKEWFEPFDTAYQALWWVPAGTLPSAEDAKARLAHLRQNGPTPHAFTFRQSYRPDGQPGQAAAVPLEAMFGTRRE